MAKKASKRYRVRWRFEDGDVVQDPADLELARILDHIRLLNHDDRHYREMALRYLREVAELAVSARIAKGLTTKIGAQKQVENRQSKNVERDRRIHAAHDAGMSNKAIAIDEGISESSVSRVLSRSRP